MITREDAQSKFSECHDSEGPHDEVYTRGAKIKKDSGCSSGQPLSFSWLMRQPAASCPKESRIAAPALQPSP